VETQSIEGHTHRTPLPHSAANWYVSVLITIYLDRGRSTFIHPFDTGDKDVSNAISLGCLKQVVVGDPIESIFKIKGKHT
jgi:hypothetical protein